jgi:glucose-1-phosphate cytidylyltransferase
MQVVILAGGLGTRLGELTNLIPKPMIEVGEMPILWHIMKIYSHYGFDDFVICLGYKGQIIRDFFLHYKDYYSKVLHCSLHPSSSSTCDIHSTFQDPVEKWNITLVDTGKDTGTAGRLKQIEPYVSDEFMMTYGDGVGNVDIPKLIQTHKDNNTIATITCVQPLGRFGALTLKDNKISSFQEKVIGDGKWINGGFAVLKKEVFSYIKDDKEMLEQEPLQKLSEEGQLGAYQHYGFWHPMDNMHDRIYLEDLWNKKEALWKVW